MTDHTTQTAPQLARVLDANLNRLREGIRVVEDILRYKENNKELSKKLKNLRHMAVTDNTTLLLKHRDAHNDILRPSTASEQSRSSLIDIFIANFKRAEESARVLEELYKLESLPTSERFKTIRYELYTLEKNVLALYE